MSDATKTHDSRPAHDPAAEGARAGRGVRLVVFDATDTGRFKLGHDGSHGTSAVRVGLTPAWWVGARLHALARAVRGEGYAFHGVHTWDEAIAFAASHAPVAELQVWGHGGWGFMDLGDTRLSRATLPRLDPLRAALAGDARVWLRCCSAFGGREGRRFAPALAAHLGCRVVGHTYVIGAWQSGTRSLAPAAEPDWPLDEGVTMRGGEPHAAKGSSPFAPRTVSCLRLDLPRGW